MPKEDIDQLIKEKIMVNFKSWVQLMFEGQLVNITKCQTCERASLREESFNNISLEI